MPRRRRSPPNTSRENRSRSGSRLRPRTQGEAEVERLLRLKEPSVLLRWHKEDLHMAESVLHSAKEQYAQKANVHPPDIIGDNHKFLPPAPSHQDAPGTFCAGGVVLASRVGKIVCENTLDACLDVVFRKEDS
ncbi:hypothetical protein MLD38_035350 [Melastoma candidum]|uniref:Uncharacterized protein n=1 Tax=Melastoma candidum TaxID=119954 RepID=A0ACB9LFX8_9MYRT|nr:hypothetical protein MLD38_035350 [Melastoma candidum]